MMGEIGRTLKDLHFVGPIRRQVVLVGGSADLKGIADYTQAAGPRARRQARGLRRRHGGAQRTGFRNAVVWFFMRRRTRSTWDTDDGAGCLLEAEARSCTG